MNNCCFGRLLTGVWMITLLAGCGAVLPRTYYYSLYAPPQQPIATNTTTANTLVLSIGPVTIPDLLKQEKIATGGSDGRYRLSDHHRWSGNVDRDFARAVAEQLAATLGTQQVSIFPNDQHLPANCRILIDVVSMRGEPGQEALLEARWSLIDPKEQRPPLVRRGEYREPATGEGYGAWVAAQQRNIARLGAEVAAAIRETVIP